MKKEKSKSPVMQPEIYFDQEKYKESLIKDGLLLKDEFGFVLLDLAGYYQIFN